MEIVRRFADRVVVWNQGQIVAQGSADEVLNDPYVKENVVGVA